MSAQEEIGLDLHASCALSRALFASDLAIEHLNIPSGSAFFSVVHAVVVASSDPAYAVTNADVASFAEKVAFAL